MTFYLGVVDRAEDGSWGVVFPDLPGCYSAGETVDDLFAKSIEAVRLWAEDAIEDGTLPEPRSNEALLADPEVRELFRAAAPTGSVIQIPLLLDSGRNVRANISMDAKLLDAIDAAAKQRGLSRSGFLASAARDKIERAG